MQCEGTTYSHALTLRYERYVKSLSSIFSEMEKDSPARRKDFEFVIAELEKINLGEVSDRIRRDMKG